MRRPRLLCNIT